MIAVTGATGQLGALVIKSLLEKIPADRIVALVRSPEKAVPLAERGIQVRPADYSAPGTLEPALSGVRKLLLISSNNVGNRGPEHQAVIDAAKAAGVSLIAYTSILRCDTTEMEMAAEHIVTEAALRASGLGWVFLRNGWYTENHLMTLPVVLENGEVIGSAGEGRISSASRADYAAAAATVLASEEDLSGRIYELAGDEDYALADLAAEIGRRSEKEVTYVDLPQAEYAGILTGAGVPEGFAGLIAQSDDAASRGALFDDGKALSGLIGRPTTSMSDAVRIALADL